MHASSNLPSMRTKKVGTLVTTLYVSPLCFGGTEFTQRKTVTSGRRLNKLFEINDCMEILSCIHFRLNLSKNFV